MVSWQPGAWGTGAGGRGAAEPGHVAGAGIRR